MKLKQKFIGTKQFYMYVMSIGLPMILQNLVTNFVSMLDNIMVGQIGTPQMSGVSIVNQFIFVFNITIFGTVSGASIFGTQYYGKEDYEGQKYTVRFRLLLTSIIIALSMVILSLFGTELIQLFLSKDDAPEMTRATMKYGKEYLMIMVFSLIPFGIGQAYASAVRECGQTVIPMVASFVAIGVNLVLDYGLIFGYLGMPCLGVLGAAIATLIAKSVEAIVVIFWAHANHKDNPYAVGLFSGFYIPRQLQKDILIKGCPLIINEFLWSLGVSIIAQSFSVRGLDVVAARNISSTIVNLFNVVFLQLGASIGIILGIQLGAGKIEEAKADARKLMAFSLMLAVVMAIAIIPVAYVFPSIYKTEYVVKKLATDYIIIQAFAMPIWSFTNACYFTLRSGGKTGITFMFDFVFSWLVMIPLAVVLSNFTNIEIHWVFMIVTYSEILKAIAGYFLVRSNVWAQTIVED